MNKFEQLKKWMLLAQESNVKHLPPMDIFLEKFNGSEALVDFVEEQATDEELKQQARWYFAIMCVSAMEIFFKRMAEIFLQGGWASESLFTTFHQDKKSMIESLRNDKEEYNFGEIISTSNSFQNLDSINKFYTRMINKDFLKEISEFKAPLGQGKYMILKDTHPEFRKEISELVHYRNLTIHQDTVDRSLTIKYLYKMTGTLMDFVYASEFYLANISSGFTEKPR